MARAQSRVAAAREGAAADRAFTALRLQFSVKWNFAESGDVPKYNLGTREIRQEKLRCVSAVSGQCAGGGFAGAALVCVVMIVMSPCWTVVTVTLGSVVEGAGAVAEFCATGAAPP